jgi:hypothetical protein
VKALSPSTFTHHNEPGKRQQRLDKADNLTETFVLYSLGMIPKDEVKARLRQAQVGREVERSGDNSKLYWWRVQARGYHTSVELVASNKQEAIAKGKRELGMTAMGDEQMIANPIRHYTAQDEKNEQDRQKAVAAQAELEKEQDVTPEQPSTPFDNTPREWTGQWLLLNADGETIYRFGGIGNSQADANRVAGEWARSNNVYGALQVVPEMAPVLAPAQFR